jgi:hypothetical protein
MKKFKTINTTARIQDYVRDPVDLYFLVLKKLDEDIYKFSRKIGCHSYRESDGIHKGMIFKSGILPLYSYKRTSNYSRSLKTRKRLCRNTLKTQAQASRWYY